MNIQKLLCLIIATVSCASILFFAVPAAGEDESTMKYMVIRLLSDRIDPPHLTISQGTVIIWVNEAHDTAQIHFANKEMATCLNGSPVAGGRTEQGIALSIDFGRTESICLVQKGDFSYTVTRGTNRTTGTITVK